LKGWHKAADLAMRTVHGNLKPAECAEQKGNRSILGMKVLMWVLYWERPLMAEELCHAFGVELGSNLQIWIVKTFLPYGHF